MSESHSSICSDLLGRETAEATRRAMQFLERTGQDALLDSVGRRFPELALENPPVTKDAFPTSYGRGKSCDDDLLAGLGMFYLTQSGKLMLDCVSGHYQMIWGYNHPELVAAATEGMRLGIIWDNHANIPATPVKLLASGLTALTEGIGLDRVLLGVCTGTIACEAALKIMLMRYQRDKARVEDAPPVVIALASNYHGTSMATQALRGMWPDLVAGMAPALVEPNDPDELRKTFERFGTRVAGFWAEPIMMNREAIELDPEYLQLARQLCDETDALMVIDEIQTCFWYPDVLYSLRIGLAPDMIVVGKGMTAGFHPLAGLLYRSELDILEQYDAISTNGNASLAALVALSNMALIRRERERIERVSRRLEGGFRRIAADFPDVIESANGKGLLAGLKLRDREDALSFHKALVERGLWLRVHAYHEGHRTILTKCPLVVTEAIVDWLLQALRDTLSKKDWR